MQKKVKKILIVGMPFSLHTVRWVSMMQEMNLQIHFFSSYQFSTIHPKLERVVFHDFFYHNDKNASSSILKRDFRNRSFIIKNPFLAKLIGKFVRRVLKLEKSHGESLYTLIKTIQPHIIHTMESQHAGYLLNSIYEKVLFNAKIKKPAWIHTTFGIDLDYFKHFENHAVFLRQMFSKIDFFLAEGIRDVENAKHLGFNGKNFVFPSAGGGYRIQEFAKRNKTVPSLRKKIFIKGYQDSVRRGLVAIRAIVKCKDLLDGYEICAFGCEKVVEDYIQYVNSKEQLSIKVMTSFSYEQWLDALAEARITITNNLSDGIPAWFFESMLMGAFPIQSQSGCWDEWVENGVTACIVNPEEPDMICAALVKAITDNNLVDRAASINFEKISTRLEYNVVKREAEIVYNEVFRNN